MSKAPKSTARGSRSLRPRTTSDAIEILDRRVIGDDPDLRAQVRAAEFELAVAQIIHDARTDAGLAQHQLAELIGTSQSVISRLEDADFNSQSLSMLRRIAGALGKRLEVRLVDGASVFESA
ncbi:MAG: XRE family transcriptional regulator [Phycisphaerales bacterium]|nr:XRE family transcriptional regulator [Phycisphaerales bacterium]